jgi:hypothetical protein
VRLPARSAVSAAPGAVAAAALAATCAASFRLAACGDSFDNEGIVVESSCAEQSVDALRPRDDEDEAYADGWVWADLACAAPRSVITVERLNGDSAPGLVSVQHAGRQVRFRPAPRLSPQTTYVAHLDVGDAYRDWRFTTSTLGRPLGAALDGRGLAVLPETIEVLDPPGLAEALGEALAGWYPVLQFLGEPQGGGVAMRLGARAGMEPASGQDLSQATTDLVANWDDPYFRLGPFRLDHALPEGRLVLEDAVVAGAVRDAGWDSGGGGISLQGRWDTRWLEDAIGSGPGSLCDAAEAAGAAACEPCDDGGAACLAMLLVHGPAAGWTGVLAGVP